MAEQKRHRITEAAQILGVNPWTLRRKVYNNEISFIKEESGRVYIPTWWVLQQVGEQPKSTVIRCAIYARESSSENKTAMELQIDGLTRYAMVKGYRIVSVTKEFASGLNDNRKKLHKLFDNSGEFDVLLVENKDRLTRLDLIWPDSALNGLNLLLLFG